MNKLKKIIVASLLCIATVLVGALAACDGDNQTPSGSTPPLSDFTPHQASKSDLIFTQLNDGSYSVKAANTSMTGELEIPSTYDGNAVTEIFYAAFSGCSGLTSITIPNSVTSICESAFSGCSGLTSITIPNSVTKIKNGAIVNCSGLSNIKVASGNSVFHSNGNCLIETKNKVLLAGCRSSIIPSDGSVTSIASSAFFGCSGLTSINIPDSVTRIGNSAFNGCSGLTSVKIPEGMTVIETMLFSWCSSLTNIDIPDKVESICWAAFEGCASLTSITIPISVKELGGTSWSQSYFIVGICGNCPKLETIYYAGTSEQWETIKKGDGRIPENKTLICLSDSF